MKHSKIFIAVAGLSLILTVACGQKKDDSPAAVAGAGVTAATGAEAFTVPAGGPGFPVLAFNQLVVSQLTNADPEALKANARLLALSDSSLTAEDVGKVIGVTIQGDVKVDKTNGTVILGTREERFSKIEVLITDEYVGQTSTNSPTGKIEPIKIFLPVISGRAAGGVTSLVFGDGLGGTIIINGTYTGVTFLGTMSFKNGSGSAGIIGKFTVATCSFFHCE